MRTDLFRKKRILSKKLSSQKGASAVFAIVGFMFAAMISLVVINAAYSAAAKSRRIKYDEQSFLLAQSMAGVITDALTGTGEDAKLPNGAAITSPETGQIKYDGLALGYQYVEQKNNDEKVFRFYNAPAAATSFTKATDGTFNIVKGKTFTAGTARYAVQQMIFKMAQEIDKMGPIDPDDPSTTSVTETLTTSFSNTDAGEDYEVETKFTMDRNYSIKAITTAKVKTGATVVSTYIVRMDAGADVRTDKLVCVGTLNATGNTITAIFGRNTVDVTHPEEKLVKISCRSVTWPPAQRRTVYSE